MTQNDVIFTREEAAEKLKISVRQFDRLVAEYAIPVMRFGTAVRVRLSELTRWMDEMQNPLDLVEAALVLGITPEDIARLAKEGALPSDLQGDKHLFYGPKLRAWRDDLEKELTIFTSIDDRAEHLQERLKEKGIDVELVRCELCAANGKNKKGKEPNVAGRRCKICDRVVCFPHALHALKNGKSVRLEPDYACDDCYEENRPETWGGEKISAIPNPTHKQG